MSGYLSDSDDSWIFSEPDEEKLPKKSTPVVVTLSSFPYEIIFMIGLHLPYHEVFRFSKWGLIDLTKDPIFWQEKAKLDLLISGQLFRNPNIIDQADNLKNPHERYLQLFSRNHVTFGSEVFITIRYCIRRSVRFKKDRKWATRLLDYFLSLRSSPESFHDLYSAIVSDGNNLLFVRYSAPIVEWFKGLENKSKVLSLCESPSIIMKLLPIIKEATPAEEWSLVQHKLCRDLNQRTSRLRASAKNNAAFKQLFPDWDHVATSMADVMKLKRFDCISFFPIADEEFEEMSFELSKAILESGNIRLISRLLSFRPDLLEFATNIAIARSRKDLFNLITSFPVKWNDMRLSIHRSSFDTDIIAQCLIFIGDGLNVSRIKPRDNKTLFRYLSQRYPQHVSKHVSEMVEFIE